MTKRKIVSLCLAAVTVAYFTDTDAKTNTFTVGNVKIELLESQYHRVNAGKGNATGEKEPLMGGYLWAADVNMQGTPENTPTTLPPARFGMASTSPMRRLKPMPQPTKTVILQSTARTWFPVLTFARIPM